MDAFVMEIAGFVFSVEPLFGSTRAYCADFLSEKDAQYRICVAREDLLREQELLNIEADEEGLKRRKFSDMFLERSVIQRRVAESLVARNVMQMHGSTVAVDGKAYLFTAACGTGKSTHTRLWREVFGNRAVMVNDDKPFLRLEGNCVYAYGSPWTGKHGLGSNVRMPLQGICVLRRGPENVIRRADAADWMDFIAHQCFLSEQAPQFLEALTRLVPLWEMECNKEQAAALTAYEAMSGI